MPDNLTVLHSASESWFKHPEQNHLVHFYPFKSDLITPLSDYISEGIKRGETCIVIATERNSALLHKQLASQGVDYAAAMESGQYLNVDAAEALNYFMVDGMPDHSHFLKTIGRIISLAAGRGKPVRAFGEMVALLWQEGNAEGMIRLEKFWNELAEKHAFSLFCAYPELHFDGSASHKQVIDAIKHTHAVTTGSFA